MSKQMAFQMTGPDLIRHLNRIAAVKEQLPDATGAQCIELATEDTKERECLRAALIAGVKCQQGKRDVFRVSKVIVWRNAEGNPDEIQIEFSRGA